ncbi:MAG: TetR family transcriptional regulator [Actinobacteria bacterium]|nr:TetR family transcriptional regulator [Actinomycetota bacterium]
MSPATTSVSTTRARILAAAIDMVTEQGWQSITMARLAQRAGVSRQTVYNEIGSKSELAEAVVLDELARFLAVVDEGFDRHSQSVAKALQAAVLGVLERARDSALMVAIVSSTSGAETELLPPLTTRSTSLLDAARSVVAARVSDYNVAANERTLDAAIDMLVRTVLSHVMQPSDTPEKSAAAICGVVLAALSAT